MKHEATARSVRSGRWLLAFFCASSVAEILQAVAIMWASYRLSHNAVVTGAMNAAAYLPGVVLGLIVRKRADSGDAVHRLSLTNWVLFAGSSLLTLVWMAHSPPGLALAAFAAVQCSLSFVKTMNKAHAGRFIRQGYSASDAVRLRQRSTSLAQAGGAVGGGAAGVLLGFGAVGWCFATTALLYLAGLLAVRRAASSPHEAEDTPVARGAGPAAATSGERRERNPSAGSRVLRTILVYSFPSSGALPFMSTVAVPLAQSVSPGSGDFYAVLSVAGMAGGFLAGTALSSGRLSSDLVLRTAFLGGAALAVGIAVTRWPAAVVVLFLVLSAVITTHVMVMQVLTNQAPPEDQVGRFTVVRNAVAGAAKCGAALVAGWLVEALGLTAAWLALALVLGAAGFSWWGVGRSREMEELVGAN
ncbi:MFS transporter [Streptomyces misionensis]|uniref:MFS transporter n=1 Tax=Streptomyces misionensis TaxID=67331 RepID=UPI00367C2BE0